MIKNEKQYQITKRKLNDFIDSLKEIENDKNSDPLTKELYTNAFKGQIEKLVQELNEFESLKDGTTNEIVLTSLTDMQEALVKARIAKGWSQGKLAEKLKLKEQQIQRYEMSNYSTANFPRVVQVLDALELNMMPLRLIIKEPDFKLPDNINSELLESAQRSLNTKKSIFEFA